MGKKDEAEKDLTSPDGIGHYRIGLLIYWTFLFFNYTLFIFIVM